MLDSTHFFRNKFDLFKWDDNSNVDLTPFFFYFFGKAIKKLKALIFQLNLSHATKFCRQILVHNII